MSVSGFYRAFEDRHRGSREVIRARLEAYQSFITPLLKLYKPAPAVDLGCGRGEWLELLRDGGFEPYGVDLDDGMLAACIELGLPVSQADAIEYLASLEDESQTIVSGFHIAEHIAFEDLDALVSHALRVLKPGGLLILETPNPENLVVGACNFYLDPNHIRPIPPALLYFLPGYHGFARARIVRLQEDTLLHQSGDNVDLISVLGGVSPDYAVVAQKTSDKETLTNFDAAFDALHGTDLSQLAGRYDQKLDRMVSALDARLVTVEAQATGLGEAMGRIATLQDRLVDTASEAARVQAERERLERDLAELATEIEIADSKVEAAEARATELEQRAAIAEARAQEAHARAISAESIQQDLQAQVDQLNGHSHHWWLQASQFEKECNDLRRSSSWRSTSLLRFVPGLLIHPVATLRAGANSIIHRSIEVFQRPLSRLMRAALRRPKLSNRINQLLLPYPALHQQLLGVAQRQGLDSGSPNSVSPTTPSEKTDPSLESLSPHARQIHADLVAAVEKHKKEA